MRLIAIILAVVLMGCGRGQSERDRAKQLAAAEPTSLSPARVAARSSMTIASDALAAGAIDLRHSAYGDNLSPPLRWTAVDGAGAYAIILEDPDAPSPSPFVHWMIWNIPAAARSLPEGLPNTASVTAVRGAMQGRNDSGSIGYFGPRPPSGTHHYRFQIFALDGPLAVSPDVDRRGLAEAMKGHVLAEGELVATFKAPAR